MSLYELIHEFLFDCKVRELSDQTITNYAVKCQSCLELYDADVDSTIPFIFLDTEEDGVFAVRFLANDVEVFFDIVDQDTIINDIYDILSSATPNSAIEEEEAAEFAEADEAA